MEFIFEIDHLSSALAFVGILLVSTKWITKRLVPGLALMFGGVVCPIAALIKLIGGILGFDVPISLFEIGSFHMPLAVGFILAVILGFLLLFAGRYLWKLTRKYIAWIVSLKRTMLGQQEENL